MRLRFFALVLAVSLSVARPAAAQFDNVSVTWGPTLGFNFATLRSDDVDVNSQTAFSGGLVAQLSFPGPVSVQPELLFVQKGGAVDTNEGSGEVRYDANYIELPVAVRVDGPRIRTVRPHLLAGGFGGVKIFERQSAGGDEIRFPIDTETSFFHRTNAGVLVGLGATLTLGGGRLGVEVRYARGLVDVAQDLEDDVFPFAPFPTEAQTQTWLLLVRFGL